MNTTPHPREHGAKSAVVAAHALKGETADVVAERDHFEELKLQADLCNLANSLLPTMILSFMRACAMLGLGGKVGSPPATGASYMLQLHLQVTFLSLAGLLCVFNILVHGKSKVMLVHWERITCFTMTGLFVLLALIRASVEVNGVQTEGFVSPYVRFSIVYEKGTLPPRTSCVDTQPWKTALEASPLAWQNENAGCEGRYNNAWAVAGNAFYISSMAMTRLRGRHVMSVVSLGLIAISFAAFTVGAHNWGLARHLFILALNGTVTATICERRRAQAMRNTGSLRRMIPMAQRCSELLATLIPPEVLEAAHDGDAPGAEAEIRGLELTAQVDRVLVMFCVISPSLDSCSSREAFDLLNRVFLQFDHEVQRKQMFKYHHFSNTFLVASPAAALRRDVFGSWQEEVDTMLALGLRLKELAAGFVTPDGRPLSLGIGLSAGPVVGRIIGGYRSYWSLFGDALPLSARLAGLSLKDTWRARCCAAAGGSGGQGGGDDEGVSGWEADPVKHSIACSIAVTETCAAGAAADGSAGNVLSRTQGGTAGESGFVFEHLGTFNIKGKGETPVVAARRRAMPLARANSLSTIPHAQLEGRLTAQGTGKPASPVNVRGPVDGSPGMSERDDVRARPDPSAALAAASQCPAALCAASQHVQPAGLGVSR